MMDLRQSISTANGAPALHQLDDLGGKLGVAELGAHATAIAAATIVPGSAVAQCATAAQARTDLTRREREVLELLCHRLTDSEIAHHLCIGTRTVESHVSRILDKLQASNRREAAAAAIFLGLI